MSVKKTKTSYFISRGDMNMSMSKTFGNFKNLKDVLRGLIEQHVTIILISGQRLNVEVDAIVDNLLVASIGNRILFIDIECICVVVSCCEEILEFVLTNMRRERKTEDECSRGHKDFFVDDGSKSCDF